MLVYGILLGIPALGAAGVSVWLAWAMGRQILTDEPNQPLWLEALAPLKGRWLSLLLYSPVILFAMAFTFLAVAASLYILIGLILYLCHFAPVLAALVLGLLGILIIQAVRRASRTASTPGGRTG